MQLYEKVKSKRKWTLLASYIAMTIAVILISTVCILLVMGYRFNFSSRSVEQGALLQFNSVPSGAQIVLDSGTLSFSTPGKKDVAVGSHEVKIQLEGYRDWGKRFSVSASEVRWLNYARLVPTTVETQSVKEFASLTDELPSPDSNWIVILPKSDAASFVVADLRDVKNLKFSDITIPAAIMTMPVGVTHNFDIVEWDDNSRYVLISHDFSDGKREYIRINRENKDDVVNITTKLGVEISNLHFSSSNLLYGIENGNLRRFDLNNSSLSQPLVKDVIQMKLYGTGDLAYVTQKDSKVTVGVTIGSDTRTIATYDETIPVLVGLGKYYNESYLAVTRGASFELLKNPQKSAEAGMEKVITLTYPGDIKWINFSPNGRSVIAGNGTQFMTYDIELARRTDTNFPGSVVEVDKPLQWLDEFILVSAADSKLRISDFDGENQQIITDSLPSQSVMLSADDKFVYSFSKTQAGAISLQSSKMTVDR